MFHTPIFVISSWLNQCSINIENSPNKHLSFLCVKYSIFIASSYFINNSTAPTGEAMFTLFGTRTHVYFQFQQLIHVQIIL